MEADKRSNAMMKKIGSYGLIGLLLFILLFYWIVNESWSVVDVETRFATLQMSLPDLEEGAVVEQKVNYAGNQVQQVVIYPNMPAQAMGGVTAQLVQDGAVVAEGSLSMDQMKNMEPAFIDMGRTNLPRTGETTLRILVQREDDGKFFSLFYGDSIDVGRYQIAATDVKGLKVNGETVSGHLDMALQGKRMTQAMVWFWYAAAAVVVVYMLAFMAQLCCEKKGKLTFASVLLEELQRYGFLIYNLVSRDFNTKYRQSVLGVLWSFLNPLLTMVVQYIVFSTLFRSNIPNFVAYLMTGIVFFNFFSEAAGTGMTSITSNAALINKVYVPKYIYPLSRVLSALINLLIALVPMLLVVFLSGVPVTKAFLLLPLPILLLTVFSLGMGMLLATSNVFFRDTAFLWSVVVMLWNFLTPIFYPESIIPAALQSLYHMNPMYQFIYFIRCIVLDGVTPQPVSYLYCILCAVIPFVIGLWVFRRNQNKFVLHL